MNDTSREAGSAIGTAIRVTVLAGQYRSALPHSRARLPTEAAESVRHSSAGGLEVATPMGAEVAFADDVGRAFTTGFTDAMPVVGVALVVTPAACPAFARDVPGARNRSLPKARTSSASPTHRVPDPDAGRSAHQTFDQRLPGVTGKIADPGPPRPAGDGRGDGRRPSLAAAVHSPEATGLEGVLELVVVVAWARARRPWAAQEQLRSGAVPLARMTAGDEGPRLTDRTDFTALPPRER
ncbi:hypothetical protein ACH475_34245 [Streptomyces globisporus]|uniref:hypothetical protein n=1 Tax=Streptomyces globisporus TaxID=1908 RepID=UPI0037983640